MHGDDFTFYGDDRELKRIAGKLAKWYEIVVRAIIAPDEWGKKEATILNQTVRWTDEGIRISADTKHAGRIIAVAGLETDSKPLAVNGRKDDDWTSEDET